jgi:hypothetical protein
VKKNKNEFGKSANQNKQESQSFCMKSRANEALFGIQQVTLLSLVFFSEPNMKIVQNALRKRVYDVSEKKYLISGFYAIGISFRDK